VLDILHGRPAVFAGYLRDLHHWSEIKRGTNRVSEIEINQQSKRIGGADGDRERRAVVAEQAVRKWGLISQVAPIAQEAIAAPVLLVMVISGFANVTSSEL
jgi:hypothetical protein